MEWLLRGAVALPDVAFLSPFAFSCSCVISSCNEIGVEVMSLISRSRMLGNSCVFFPRQQMRKEGSEILGNGGAAEQKQNKPPNYHRSKDASNQWHRHPPLHVQELINYRGGANLALHLLLQIKFCWNTQLCPLVYVLSMAGFVLYQQSGCSRDCITFND